MPTEQQHIGLPSTNAAPRLARQVLLGAGLPAAIEEDAALVVSELVTNAIVHGAPPVELRIGSSPDGWLIEVCDAAAGEPKVRTLERPDAAGGGRGLRIVDRMATSWGVRPERGGKCVWAAFPAS